MKHPIVNLDKYGLIKDAPAIDIPEQAVSDGNNVVFIDGKCKKSYGYTSVFGTPTVAPYWAMAVPTATTYYWIYTSLTKCYVTDGTTHTNITRQTASADVNYNATGDNDWNGTFIGGTPVINNGIDSPQMWITPISASNKMTSLTFSSGQTWTSKGYTASVFRQFKNFGIALDFNNGTTRYPQMVLWSDPAPIGTVPSTWDWTDTTSLAGRNELAGGGFIIDGKILGEQFIIYKEDAIFRMYYVGGNDVFGFEKISDDGVFSRHCVAEFPGGHVVYVDGDVKTHQGNIPQSIISGKLKRFLASDIDTTYNTRVFLVHNMNKNEIWICYPSSGNSYPNKAITWNYVNNTFGLRSLSSTSHIANGVVDTSATGTTWNSYTTTTWNAAQFVWGARSYNPSLVKLLGCDPTNTKLYLYDDDTTNQHNLVNPTAYVEKTDIIIDDLDTVKFVNRVYPKIQGSGDITVQVGTQSVPNGAVSWSASIPFTIGTSYKVDVRKSGKLLAYRIQSTGNVSWEFTGIEFEYVHAGKR
jgi:hypothetical protein